MLESESINSTLLWVGVAATAWCVLHSLLITRTAPLFWRRLLGRHESYTRLLYNAFSVVSLAVLMWWWRSLPTMTVFEWQGGWLWLRVIGLTAGVFFLLAGVRVYDNDHVLGLAQIKARTNPSSSPGTHLHVRGILLHMRHPYYTAGLLVVIFGSNITDVNIVWRSVFCVYLIVGAFLEENKLLAEFGQEYARYRQTVPMFWPRLKPARWSVRPGQQDSADRKEPDPSR